MRRSKKYDNMDVQGLLSTEIVRQIRRLWKYNYGEF